MAQPHQADPGRVHVRALGQPDPGREDIAHLFFGIDPIGDTVAVTESAVIEIERVETGRRQVAHEGRHVGFLAAGIAVHTDDRRRLAVYRRPGKLACEAHPVRIKFRRFALHVRTSG